MASLVWPRFRETSRPGEGSRHTRSVSSTSTSPRSGHRKGSSTLAIDRTSKFAFVQLVEKADTVTSRAFLDALVAAVPYKIKIVLTDNGIQFADLPKNRSGPTARWRGHPFDRACQHHGIEHRLTRPNHPWTNGQVERMNRTLKEATVQRYYYDSHHELRRHLDDFLSAYNFGRRLKTLKGLTPYEFICKMWTSQPKRFTLNPIHQMPGLRRKAERRGVELEPLIHGA